jgi:hypothetical protein
MGMQFNDTEGRRLYFTEEERRASLLHILLFRGTMGTLGTS